MENPYQIRDRRGSRLNTFRKMLKEDVSHLNEKIEIYRKQMEEQHDREVEKKRRKRIRSK